LKYFAKALSPFSATDLMVILLWAGSPSSKRPNQMARSRRVWSCLIPILSFSLSNHSLTSSRFGSSFIPSEAAPTKNKRAGGLRVATCLAPDVVKDRPSAS